MIPCFKPRDWFRRAGPTSFYQLRRGSREPPKCSFSAEEGPPKPQKAQPCGASLPIQPAFTTGSSLNSREQRMFWLQHEVPSSALRLLGPSGLYGLCWQCYRGLVGQDKHVRFTRAHGFPEVIQLVFISKAYCFRERPCPPRQQLLYCQSSRFPFVHCTSRRFEGHVCMSSSRIICLSSHSLTSKDASGLRCTVPCSGKITHKLQFMKGSWGDKNPKP